MKAFVLAGAAALMLNCVPETQSGIPPCPPPVTVSYLEAPNGLVTEHVAESAAQFESLSGDLSVDILCDPDWGGATIGGLSMQPTPISELRVIQGSRQECGNGDVQWSGDIVVHAPAFDGLDGSLGSISGFDPTFYRVQFDASYDTRLSAVWLQVFLDGNTPFAKLEFALKPTTSASGVTTQEGHECIVELREP